MENDNINDYAIINVLDLKKHYTVKSGILGSKATLKAVDGISLEIKKNSVFALVGESGCGKSTVAKMILRLLTPTEGKILFYGLDINTFGGKQLKQFRRSVQIIFQDPFASLNPRMRIYETLKEPLKIHNLIPSHEYKDKAAELLEMVGMNTNAMTRYPHEFSGGQRQRICIARALALSPELIVADEPLSALDVSIQAQILNLLKGLKEEFGLSFLFISHNLNIVQYFSDEIAVMYLGVIVEQAKTDLLFANPLHPYTKMLIESVPKIEIYEKTEQTLNNESQKTIEQISPEMPSPLNIPKGCPFHPRCKEKFAPCASAAPLLKKVKDRRVSCYLYEDNLC
ncbi:peptide/nickel ABC transporter ATP-binding protein [Candidatus Magnetoovum chiemensis]|nr:peptide/nickel ABC transporter ATP-binding protein [Candidatus Magnetoovum chiemensis]